MANAEKPEPAETGVPWLMAVRGVGLLVGSLSALVVLAKVMRRSRTLGLLATVPLAGAGALLAWAAAIHLTGGEKFDDHPWV